MIDAAELRRLVDRHAMYGVEASERALSDFLLSHASELLALVEADGWRTIDRVNFDPNTAIPMEAALTQQQDDYLRKGVGEKMAIPAVTQALRQRMRDRPVYDPEAGGRRELYAMPAATPEFLENASVDLAEWLAGEVTDAFNMQRGNLPFEPDGDVEVLRDPYSAKPYVLFYCTLKMAPPPEPAQ